MSRIFTPLRLLVAGAVLGVVTLGVLWLAPSDDYLLLPDEAHPVAPLVTVETPKRGGGKDGIYFVDLLQRRATLLESFFPSIRDGSTLVPEERLNPHGIAESVRKQADLGQMARSQEIAAAVALRQLGYDVEVRERGAFVVSVFEDLPAVGKVSPGEVIVAVDGRPVRSTSDLQQLIAANPPGTEIALTLENREHRRRVRLTTAPNPELPKRSVIGVLVEPAADIRLPIDVSIDAGSIGGPSAGLAFALDVMEKLGTDVDHGRRVAATGELSLDGSVHRVGGMKQKTIGARAADVDVFLVPVENVAEARRHAGDLRIVPVRSLPQAVRALSRIPE
ncbi:MAG TPA: S16 family serine protease [Gaiellaceae bacterium]|nr:S16 family serine protease [Gaiellaceae bacterium]